ncbi:MAG: DUF6502 family protein [Rhodoferax sp.]|nr:DUF6502 family protein [Rhodoferax sp.]
MLDQVSWTQAACSRVLRPVVRLALTMGLKYSHLDTLLRELMLDEARRLWLATGISKPNISQLAMTTGLNRKDVTARIRDVDAPSHPSGLSPAANVFTAWLQLARENPDKTRLPINASAQGASFETLARQASRGNVHHRAVLDELIRLGMVVEKGGWVELAADGFVPAGDLQSMLALLGDNTRDHLQAAVSNTLGEPPRMLERAVYADGLTQEECECLHQLARQRWDTLHHELVQEMTAAIERSGPGGNQRIKIGIYTLYEEVKEAGFDSPVKSPPAEEKESP